MFDKRTITSDENLRFGTTPDEVSAEGTEGNVVGLGNPVALALDVK